MEIIDAQVHCWEAESQRPASRPWDPAFNYGHDPNEESFTYHDAIVAMNAVGVDAAVLSIPPGYRRALEGGAFRYDNSYAEEASTTYPRRLVSMARWDHHDPDIDDLMAETRSRPGTLGVRTVIISPQDWEDYEAGRYDALFAAAERHEVPIMLFVSRRPEAAGPIAQAHPNLQLIVDHLGLPQPPHMQADPDPFERLPRLLDLARYPNVAVKLSGVPTLSKEPYPFRDLWPHIHKILDAFSVDRVMWGSDVTRCWGLHTWAEALFYIRHTDELSEGDKEKVLGGTLRKLLRWPAT